MAHTTINNPRVCALLLPLANITVFPLTSQSHQNVRVTPRADTREAVTMEKKAHNQRPTQAQPQSGEPALTLGIRQQDGSARESSLVAAHHHHHHHQLTTPQPVSAGQITNHQPASPPKHEPQGSQAPLRSSSLSSMRSQLSPLSAETSHSEDPPRHFYDGLPSAGFERTRHLHRISEVAGTRDRDGGRRGAVSGPSAGYYAGKYEREKGARAGGWKEEHRGGPGGEGGGGLPPSAGEVC